MEKFIKPSDIKPKREPLDRENMYDFIKKMNRKLKKHDNMLNTVLDKVYLNDSEFKHLKAEAKKSGWKLTRFDDNYNTITYMMEKL